MDEAALSLPLVVVFLLEPGEAHLAGNVDLLASGELELGTAQGLSGDLNLLVLGADGDQDLADLHSGGCSIRLSEGAAHTGRQAIGTSARQSLVDTQNVVRMRSHADVEEIPSSVGDHELVRGNSGSLEALTGDLLVLIADHVGGGRELVARQLLLAAVEDPDLRIRHTSAVLGLRVGLAVGVAVASCRSAAHGDYLEGGEKG
mmetsp:Transcript_38412/g.57530  ORF Transcript_38412/g.57530 Transcript_38412/m.57530 type:complete len:203 (+) Transcript_38412:166-774(+)